MAERVLVTGGAGYIGSVLVPRLFAFGYDVTVLDIFKTSGTELATSCASPRFTPVKDDARDTHILDQLISRHDIIIPQAAFVGAPLCKIDEIGARSVN